MAAGDNSVCIITENRNFGGVEVHTLGLMQALIELGYRIELVVNRFHGYDEMIRSRRWEERVELTHTDLDGILYGETTDIRGWSHVLQRLSSRVLIFPKGNANFGQLRFLRLCRKTFRRVIFIEHIEPAQRPKGGRRHLAGIVPGFGLWWHKRRLLTRMGAGRADHIVAVSRKVRERLVEDYGYPTRKISVVHNGVDSRQFARSEARGREFRASHGISSDAFVFGMLTRLTEQKGIDIALHAFQRLLARDPGKPVCLVIAGQGPMRESLMHLAGELRLQDHVKFIGFVEHPADALSAYDVILFSSNFEGLPLGLLEGMASGCIPIVTRVSGMPEAVDSPDVGWVVEPQSPEELSGAMASVLAADPCRIAVIRANVVRRIQDHFDLRHCHRQILTICGLEAQL
jgi:glycosyltransferase involved in cell wall biosynthesis